MHPTSIGDQNNTRKVFFEGTHRTSHPNETFARISPFQRMIGVTRIANVTGLDRIGIPVCVAVRPNARSLATAQGKGVTLEAARVSALMESLEVWHAERVALPRQIGTYAKLRRDGVSVVDITRLPMQPGASLSEDEPVEWIEGFDLVSRKSTLVPFDAVSLDLTPPFGEKPLAFSVSSNGLASGNCWAESIVHAVCELIERDACALWFLEPIALRKPRQIAISTITDPTCERIVQQIEMAGLRIALWDMTSNIGIPAYASLVMDDAATPYAGSVSFCAGYGCHLSSAVAACRALCEAVQTRLTMTAGSRDDLPQREYLRTTDRAAWRRVYNDATCPPPEATFVDRSLAGDLVEADLTQLIGRLQSIGIEQIVVVDLTQPDIALPVVKVIIPGLEGAPFLSGYTPGIRALVHRMMLSRKGVWAGAS